MFDRLFSKMHRKRKQRMLNGLKIERMEIVVDGDWQLIEASATVSNASDAVSALKAQETFSIENTPCILSQVYGFDGSPNCHVEFRPIRI